MRQLIVLIILMLSVNSMLYAGGSNINNKAELVIDNYNMNVMQGHIRVGEKQTLCYIKNGIYITYKGSVYVSDVSYHYCNWRSDNGYTGTAKCLSYPSSIKKSSRLCECDADGLLSCY